MANTRFYLCFLLLLTAQFATANDLKKYQFVEETSISSSYTKEAQKRFISWDNLIKNNQDKPLVQKLYAVNNFFNSLPYKSDKNNWGEKDYWANPYEFVGSGSGDCEDYAIAKLYTLVKLGVSKKKFKFIYSKIKKEQKTHLVLAYYHNKEAEAIILDNVNNRLLLANKRKDLVYLYAFNTNIVH